MNTARESQLPEVTHLCSRERLSGSLAQIWFSLIEKKIGAGMFKEYR